HRVESENPTDDRHRNHRKSKEGIDNRGKFEVEEETDQNNGDWNNDRQTLDGVLQASELACPLEPVAGRQLHLCSNPTLRLQNGTPEVPAADAELDGKVTLLSLAVDEERSRLQLDLGDLLQGDLRYAVGRGILHTDGQITDRFDVL